MRKKYWQTLLVIVISSQNRQTDGANNLCIILSLTWWCHTYQARRWTLTSKFVSALVIFFNTNQPRPIFVYSCPFYITMHLQIEKSVDVVLGIWTRDVMQVGTDGSTELCLWSFVNSLFLSSGITLCNPIQISLVHQHSSLSLSLSLSREHLVR